MSLAIAGSIKRRRPFDQGLMPWISTEEARERLKEKTL